MFLTTGLTFQVTEIKDNPGLFPLKLGTTQIQTDHWTFVHIFNLDDLMNEYNVLEDSFTQIRLALDNSIDNKSYVREYQNTVNLVIDLQNKIKLQFEQLNPINTLKNNLTSKNRIKRGLINGLGSIIKIITGNLDHEDA